MLFNSLSFLVFLPVVWLLAWSVRCSVAARNGILLLASYVFYGAWDWRFLGLLWFSTLVDYAIALKLADCATEKGRRRWLLVSVLTNLGVLGFFKYWDFGVGAMAELLTALGFSVSLPVLAVVLPVGISFYTFQTLSYTIDVSRGARPPTRNLLSFALYVAFFPQLVAGPIERSTDLLPQLEKPAKVDRGYFQRGLLWIILGYFYKSVVADSIAPLVDEAYAAPGSLGGDVLVLATLGFALQVFGDFAGYTLIARGCASWFGVNLSENFRRPYLARDPADFWRRWHISLSEWFRVYLFTPLAIWSARRHGRWLSGKLPVFLTFLLIGVWHGAGWNFVFFGLFWATWMVFYEAWRRWRPLAWTERRGYDLLAWIGTMGGMLFSFVLFRAPTLPEAGTVFARMIDFSTWGLVHPAGYFLREILVLGCPVMAFMLWEERRKSGDVLLTVAAPWRWAFYGFAILVICVLGFRPTPFIYFQF
jgi:D-alanyl-lipoteichoic acid acyltransferase DltB (MBOAT superfamily)